MTARWVATGVPATMTEAGSVRPYYVFGELIRRTGAARLPRRGGRAIALELLRRPRLVGARMAAAQLLSARAWTVLRRLVRPTVLDLYDHPVLHLEATGFSPPREQRAQLDRDLARLVGDFEWIAVPTQSFGDLCGVPAERRIVVENGSDTDLITPTPFPVEPVVGMLSSAGPGRGIETLVAAVHEARSAVPGTRLRMALTAPHAAAAAYLAQLRSDLAALEWVTITAVPYAELPVFFAGTSLLAIPHPPVTYMDVAAPTKLFDAMAGGRPVVTTPRTETARLIRECGAGVVARSDTVEDLAAALAEVLSAPAAAGEMGDRARRCAVARFDWRVLATRLADGVLGLETRGSPPARAEPGT